MCTAYLSITRACETPEAEFCPCVCPGRDETSGTAPGKDAAGAAATIVELRSLTVLVAGLGDSSTRLKRWIKQVCPLGCLEEVQAGGRGGGRGRSKHGLRDNGCSVRKPSGPETLVAFVGAIPKCCKSSLWGKRVGRGWDNRKKLLLDFTQISRGGKPSLYP